MNEHITTIDNIKKFTDQCFDRDNDIATRIIKGILDARSPRISDISNNMNAKSKSKVKSKVKSNTKRMSKVRIRVMSKAMPTTKLFRDF